MVNILDINKLNDLLGTQEIGDEIGYGERGVIFRGIDCDSLQDFEVNAEFGSCWEDKDHTIYYKVKDGYDEARTVYIEEGGEYSFL